MRLLEAQLSTHRVSGTNGALLSLRSEIAFIVCQHQSIIFTCCFQKTFCCEHSLDICFLCKSTQFRTLLFLHLILKIQLQTTLTVYFSRTFRELKAFCMPQNYCWALQLQCIAALIAALNLQNNLWCIQLYLASASILCRSWKSSPATHFRGKEEGGDKLQMAFLHLVSGESHDAERSTKMRLSAATQTQHQRSLHVI